MYNRSWFAGGARGEDDIGGSVGVALVKPCRVLSGKLRYSAVMDDVARYEGCPICTNDQCGIDGLAHMLAFGFGELIRNHNGHAACGNGTEEGAWEILSIADLEQNAVVGLAKLAKAGRNTFDGTRQLHVHRFGRPTTAPPSC